MSVHILPVRQETREVTDAEIEQLARALAAALADAYRRRPHVTTPPTEQQRAA